MEQPCYKCGQAVEEGIAFCPHCSAPQIRVIVAEGPSEIAPPASSSSASEPSAAVPILAVPAHWSQTIRPCALAAVIATGLVTLGLHPLVAMASAGFLATVFYRQRWQQAPIRAAIGARLGALGGLLWFVIVSLVEAVFVLVLHKGDELRKLMIDALDQAASRTNDPQVLAIFARLKTPGGLEACMIAALLASFIAAIVVGAIGGALAGVLLRRSQKS